MLLDYLFPTPDIPQLTLHPFTEDAQALRAREICYLDAIYAACPYNTKEIRQVIHLFKYRRLPPLGNHLSQLLLDANFTADDDVVLCPVPLHWTRKFWRGFNQAEILAKYVSDARDIPLQSLLKRIRPTGHQAHRNREERLQAVRGAFLCTVKPLPSTVILVDDLATTGATLDACAMALKRAGAKKVEAWVVAHG